MVALPESLYEHDLLDCSYGFRPERSAHQAVKTVCNGLSSMGGGWVIDLNIQAFFDTIDHRHLRAFLQQRVKDGVILRLIEKWLNAGVLEAGQWQKGRGRKPPRARAFEVRFADAAVLAVGNEADARKVMKVLPKRFARFGLTPHPTKTRLVRFRPHREQRAETFDFQGFTHYWGKSRRRSLIIKRKTAKGRFQRGLKRIVWWCRRNRHLSLLEQHRTLRRKVQGCFAY